MGGGGGEVEAPHRRAIAEIRKHRAKEQLMAEVSAATAQVAADQVFIHRLQIVRRMHRPAPDELAKSGREPFDALVNAVGEQLLLLLPAALDLGGDMRIGPERVA